MLCPVIPNDHSLCSSVTRAAGSARAPAARPIFRIFDHRPNYPLLGVALRTRNAVVELGFFTARQTACMDDLRRSNLRTQWRIGRLLLAYIPNPKVMGVSAQGENHV